MKEKKNVGACLLSLDFFKAYDRVLVDFLLVVMKKMNFSKKFCNRIRMLHAGARTRFILENLTRSIRVRFSIRQGCPAGAWCSLLWRADVWWGLCGSDQSLFLYNYVTDVGHTYEGFHAVTIYTPWY